MGKLLQKDLSVNLTEHDIHGANDGDNVGQHVVSADVVHQGEVEEARRLDLASIGLAAPVRDQVDAKLALWCLDSCVGGSSRNLNEKEWLNSKNQFFMLNPRDS